MQHFLRFARATALLTGVSGCYQSTVVVAPGTDVGTPDAALVRDARLVDAAVDNPSTPDTGARPTEGPLFPPDIPFA